MRFFQYLKAKIKIQHKKSLCNFPKFKMKYKNWKTLFLLHLSNKNQDFWTFLPPTYVGISLHAHYMTKYLFLGYVVGVCLHKTGPLISRNVYLGYVFVDNRGYYGIICDNNYFHMSNYYCIWIMNIILDLFSLSYISL